MGNTWIVDLRHYLTAAGAIADINALQQATASSGHEVEKGWGELIEDRGSQITYSALGQQAPLEEKMKWDPDFTKRQKIKAVSKR